MSRSWCVSLWLLALAVGCLLPVGTVDPELDPETDVGSAVAGSPMGGAGGAGGTTSMTAGAGRSWGAGSTTMMAASGSGGTASAVIPPPMAGAGGASGPDQGVAGAAGSQSMGAGGTGGSAMRLPLLACAGTTEEETCAAYCTNYEQSCGDYAPAYTYASLQDCLNTCTAPLWPVGTITQKGSILCRCYHATLALNGERATHCYHAAEKPTLVGGCEL